MSRPYDRGGWARSLWCGVLSLIVPGLALVVWSSNHSLIDTLIR